MTDIILYWNCCGGLQSKIDTVKVINKDYKPDLFFISEAEIKKDTPLEWYNIEEYILIPSSNYSSSKSRLVLYHKKCIEVQISHAKTQGLELITAKMGNNNVTGVYRPFKSGAGLTFREELVSILEELKPLTSANLVICGDLNINWAKGNAEKKILSSFADEHALKQLIKKFTWKRIVTVNEEKVLRQSVLDLVLTNTEARAHIEDQWTSDHSLIKVNTILNMKKNEVNRQKHWTRDWKKYDLNNIRDFITSKTNDNVEDELLDPTILKIQSEVQDIFCPLRRVRTARPTDIVTNEVEKLKKKRKRLLFKLNKDPGGNYLTKINQLNLQIRSMIKSERKRIINTKLKSPNPKSFWHEIRSLQGLTSKQDWPEFITDAGPTKNEEIIANSFASFFVGKVNKLSNNTDNYNWIRKEGFEEYTMDELIAALKSFKRKMSSGEDTIMMKTVRDTAWMMPDLVLKMMNNAAKNGMPLRWKLAIVKPLHKKGSKCLTENYRPISNLQSISKLYEKLILNRINTRYPGIDGDHQHGFRNGRSTCSALLELQNYIGQNLDQNKKVLTYTIDMTAAFDLLRPNIFDENSPFDNPITNQLMDFMSNRQMKVQYGNKMSKTHDITVGCVQGSVLGPKLFSVYCRDLPTNLPKDAFLISYADDSYVSFSGINIVDLETTANDSLKKHTEYMTSIGMIVNQTKTEAIVFSRNEEIKSHLQEGSHHKHQSRLWGYTWIAILHGITTLATP